MSWKNVLISILSVIITVLGGSQYQQVSSLNDLQKDLKQLEQSVQSIAHRDIARFESE